MYVKFTGWEIVPQVIEARAFHMRPHWPVGYEMRELIVWHFYQVDDHTLGHIYYP